MFLVVALVVSLLVLSSCADPSSTKETPTDSGGVDIGTDTGATDSSEPVDEDRDGFPVGQDCDDANPTVHSGADEICNGLDDDCDGVIDPDDSQGAVAWYPDMDGDGAGASTTSVMACAAPAGFVAEGGDCDDDHPYVHPDATEVCGGVDEDCDGSVDEDDAVGAVVWRRDMDADGFGDPSTARSACVGPAGWVFDATDCDDTASDVNPWRPEYCDGRDEDCDGTVDEADAWDSTVWYTDLDADGYGVADGALRACVAPLGYSARGDDCDDSAADIHPGATERCDGDDTDEDCDGVADDADSSTVLASGVGAWADTDGDGFGNAAAPRAWCDLPSGWVVDAADCDDTTASVNPAATEVCDALDTDEDCDGLADDADFGVSVASLLDFRADTDGDGYGAGAVVARACEAPVGAAREGGAVDCDDAQADVNPGATEVCDAANADEDCDGLADDADSSVLASTKTWFPIDRDMDGYAPASGSELLCDATAGHATARGDCDDADATVSPAAEDVCFDGVDNDCDGVDSCSLDAADAHAIYPRVGGTPFAETSDVADGGDIDGDGRREYLFAAEAMPYFSSEPAVLGRLYVCDEERTGTLDPDVDCVYLEGGPLTRWTDHAASAVVGMGDLDADGYDDFVVGASNVDVGSTRYAGAVYVMRGPVVSGSMSAQAHATWTGTVESGGFGTRVGNAGDVDGDGRNDLLVSAPWESYGRGVVYLVTDVGTGTSSATAATATLTGETADDYAGFDVDGCGDVDADGFADLCIGAPNDDDGGTNGGALYVVNGPVSGTVYLSSSDGKRWAGSRYTTHEAGSAVSRAGDINDDGYADVAVGAVGEYGGWVAVEYGPVTGSSSLTSADVRISGTEVNFGASIASADIDGDGRDDLVVGDDADTRGGLYHGSVQVFLGPLAHTMDQEDADAVVFGDRPQYFGYVIATVPRPDGADVLVSGTYRQAFHVLRGW